MKQLTRPGAGRAVGTLLWLTGTAAQAQQMPVNLPANLPQQAQQLMRSQPLPPRFPETYNPASEPGVPGSHVTYVPRNRAMRELVGDDELPPARPGSYELLNGQRASGPLVIANDKLILAGQRKPLVFSISEVRRVCYGPDTLLNLGAFTDPTLHRPVGAALAQRFYRRAGYEVFYYPLGPPLVLISQARFVLRQPDGTLRAVPDSPARLSQALLPVLGDCPAVAQRLRQAEARGEQVTELLDQYLSWQLARP